jgi:hypothetical protein
MKLNRRSAVVAAIVLLHLLACAMIAFGCWLNPTQLRVAQPQVPVPGKPAPRVFAQRTKSCRMMPFAHAGQCCFKPAKK